MQTRNRFFGDMARLAGGAAGVAAGLRGEAEAALRLRLERMLAEMNLVTREDYEATREALVVAREEQAALAIRVAALEAEMARMATPRRQPSTGRTSANKTGTGKAGARKTDARKTGSDKAGPA